MRYYKISALPSNDGQMVAGVSPLEGDEEEIFDKRIIWDCSSLDDRHDIWVEDGSLFTSTHFARIGSRRNIPLPAMILGVNGENRADASIPLEDMLGMVALEEV